MDPAQRFATLVGSVAGEPDVQPPDAAGGGAPFENGRRRPMREWVALTGDPADDVPLLREALDLARSRAQPG